MLINPLSDLARQSDTYFRSVTPLPPAGLTYLSAVLKNNNIKVFVEDQYATRISNEELIRKIIDVSPIAVGFSCLTTAMGNVERLVRQIKTAKIKTKIILGNIHPTLFSEEVLLREIADIVIRGEGEQTLLQTVISLDRGDSLDDIKGISYIRNGEIRHNPDRGILEDLDSLPYPDWHSLNLKHYTRYPMLGIYNRLVLPVQASRGCPYNCLFCSQDKFYKKPRYRKIKKVVDEIEYLYEEFKINYVGFIDAYFPFSKDCGLEFCDEFIRRGLHKKISWFTETRVDMVDPELLKRMKESNLSLIMYGFEVGNQKVLDDIGKRTTLDQARRAMESTRKFKIRSVGLFMLGLPSDTKKTCYDTIRFAKEINTDICKFNIAIPYPGSKFFDDCKLRLGNINDINDKFTSWYDWSSYDGEIIYNPESLTKRELVKLQRKGMFSFYMRPRFILRSLINRTFSFTDLWHGACILFKNYFKKC